MTATRARIQENGQEFQQDDFADLSDQGGLADDRALQRLLRLRPFDGANVSKAIIPYGFSGDTAPIDGLVTAGTTGGTVRVLPFTAIIGSRTAEGTSAIDNWLDIRSSDWVGATDSLDADLAIAANSSGNARWDLIFVAFAVDVSGDTGPRYVRDPTTGVVPVSPTSVTLNLKQSITVGVLTGTPSGTPAQPALPSDTGGTYHIPLAYVAIPTGWGGSSTLAKARIQIVAPIIPASGAAASVLAANGQFKSGGSFLSTAKLAAWATSGTRPPAYVPSSIAGRKTLIIALDVQDASSANWSHANGAVVDDSQDWSHCVATWHAMVNTSSANVKFPWDQGLTSSSASTPQALATPPGTYESSGMGQSFTRDALASTGVNSGFLMLLTSARISALGAATVGLYVDYADGNKLKLYVSGTPGARVFAIVDIVSRFSNVA